MRQTCDMSLEVEEESWTGLYALLEGRKDGGEILSYREEWSDHMTHGWMIRVRPSLLLSLTFTYKTS